MAEIKKVYLGATEVDKIYQGTALTYEKAPVDTTAPITTAYPTGGTYYDPQTVRLEVNEACTTYYTTDGTTPTTNSTVFTEAITISETTTLKFFSVDTAGNTESVKTELYEIKVANPTNYRYVRFVGHGDQTGVTTRLVEVQALEGATNRMAGLMPISGETPNAGASVSAVTDGVITHASGTYPIWWTAEGVPTLTYDMGAIYLIDTAKVVMYSTVNDPRQTQFKLYMSEDNVTWNLIMDMSNNTTAQSESGWTITL